MADDLPSGGRGRVGEPGLCLKGGHQSGVRDRRVGNGVGRFDDLAREVVRRLAQVVVERGRVRPVDKRHRAEQAADEDQDADEDLDDREAALVAQRALRASGTVSRFEGVFGHLVNSYRAINVDLA